MRTIITLSIFLALTLYSAMGFYEDKVDAEFRAMKAERALRNAISDTNATKASYKQAIDAIDKIRKEAEREKCKLKSLSGGEFIIKL